MDFKKSIVEIIKERSSIRNYQDQPLTEDVQENLNKYIDKIKGPFNVKVSCKLIDSSSVDTTLKLGTYGVIKGAKYYILGKVEKKDYDLEELGFVFENIILYATSLGLGTCWLGGTFRRGEFAKAMDLKSNESLPVVTPVGYGTGKRGVVDNIFRSLAGSKSRKPGEELFFNGNFSQSLGEKDAVEWALPLEMVRIAPSASNKQPWRIVKEGEKLHFYRQETPKYSDKLGFNIQRIDMGIAMCHFQLALEEIGKKGQWIIDNPSIGVIPENTFYTATWMKNK